MPPYYVELLRKAEEYLPAELLQRMQQEVTRLANAAEDAPAVPLLQSLASVTGPEPVGGADWMGWRCPHCFHCGVHPAQIDHHANCPWGKADAWLAARLAALEEHEQTRH